MLVAIDHGNKAIKHPNGSPFTTALYESDSPIFGKDVLHYKGCYYTHSEERRTYDREKSEDDTFLIFSLFAIASIDERQIDAILTGQASTFPAVINNIVTGQTQAFVNDLLSQLRERGIDMRTMDTVFVGGGSILLKRFIASSGKTGHTVFVEDVKANVRGYEILYRIDKDTQGQ